MKIEMRQITPALASMWLKKNHNVRPLMPGIVEQYKWMFKNGEYVETHQGIAFNGNGLIDGQHRLSAIASMPANFKVRMLVATGLPEAANLAMDIGKKRSASTILGETCALVAMASLFHRLVYGSGNTMTPTSLKPFVEFVRPADEDLTKHCNTASKMWSSAPIRSAYSWIFISGGDAEYAKSIYRALVLGNYKELPSIANSFMRGYFQGNVRASNKWDTFVRALKVFDPAEADKKFLTIKDVSPTLATIRAGVIKRMNLK